MNYHKGFIAPLLLALIAFLLLGGGAYVYMQKNQTNQSATATSTTQTSDPQTTDWKVYTNTKNGYQLKYPATWQVEENLDFSARIFNPRAQGKPDTDLPQEALGIGFKQTPCETSDWKIGFGFANYKTACIVTNPLVYIGMVALSETSKEIEAQILSTFQFSSPVQTLIKGSIKGQRGNWVLAEMTMSLSGFSGNEFALRFDEKSNCVDFYNDGSSQTYPCLNMPRVGWGVGDRVRVAGVVETADPAMSKGIKTMDVSTMEIVSALPLSSW